MNSPLVSIIVNNYNKGKYLEECLESIVNQTYTNWEIIFWDDNSTDDSLKVFNSFWNRNMHITGKLISLHITSNYFEGKKGVNLPLGVTRWLAVQKCKGKYIAFLDSDDKWHKDKLKEQVNFMENSIEEYLVLNGGYSDSSYYRKQGLILTFTDMRYFGEGFIGNTFFDKYPPKFTIKKKDDAFIRMLTKYNFIPMSTVMVDRKALLDVIGESTHYTSGEDYDWWLKITNKYNIGYIKDCLTYYRLVPDSLTHGKKQRIRAQWYEIDAVREGMNYRELTKWEKVRVYLHLCRLYTELIVKEILYYVC